MLIEFTTIIHSKMEGTSNSVHVIHNNFHTVFEDMMHDMKNKDVVIYCKDGHLRAHRVILAAVSPLLRTLLQEERLDMNIMLHDFRKSTVENMLYMAYVGEGLINVTEMADLDSLLKVLQFNPMINYEECSADSNDGEHEIVNDDDNEHVNDDGNGECNDQNDETMDSDVEPIPVEVEINAESPDVKDEDISEDPLQVISDEENGTDFLPRETGGEELMGGPSSEQTSSSKEDFGDSLAYTCFVCFEKFNATIAVKKHMTEQHPGKNVYKCEFCRMPFNHLKFLYAHRSENHGKYSCPICQRKFFRLFHLERHVNSQCGDKCQTEQADGVKDIETRFYCKMCKKKFLTSVALAQHMKRFHKLTSIKENPKPKKKKAPSPKKSAASYNAPMVMLPPDNLPASPQDPSEADFRFKCLQCFEMYPDEDTLKLHRKSHQPNQVFTCYTCSEEMHLESEFHKHMTQKHLGQKPQCLVCAAVFTNRKLLLRHIRKHYTDEEPSQVPPRAKDILRCSQCGAIVSSVQELEKHTEMHTFQLPFKCNICENAFPSIEMLLEHMSNNHKLSDKQVDLGDVPMSAGRNEPSSAPKRQFSVNEEVECNVCHRVFSNETNMKRHRTLVHKDEANRHNTILNNNLMEALSFSTDGETSSESTFSNRRFTSTATEPVNGNNSDSASEDALPSRANFCFVCHQTFPQAADLRKHKQSHPVGSMYKCDICSKAFAALKHVIEHRLLHSNYKPFKCTVCPRAYRVQRQLMYHMRKHDQNE